VSATDENGRDGPSTNPMAELQLWCQMALIGPGGAVLATRRLCGVGAPGIEAVDDVARLALAAARLGGRVVMGEVSPEMAELLELAGLGVEVEW
jgi:hypothetical protein